MPFKKGETPEGAKLFEKGESGNPNGRPLGTPNRSTILKKWLTAQTDITNPLTKTKERGTVEDEVILALIMKARQGDVTAIKEVLDTMHGKIREQLEAIVTHKEYEVDIGGTISNSESESAELIN